MIIDSSHIVSVYVNGEVLELEPNGVSIRLNNVIFDPETNKTTQATYSFSFDIPSTPNNNRIFDLANDLPKLNKFNKRFNAEVYADETLIFQGSLSLRQYDHEKKVYKANLVSYKVNSIDDIFGDTVLSDIPWYVDFQGASTINTVNADDSTKYFFPLAAYGVFQKTPYLSDEVGNEYTSKFDIDKYNKFWVESFYPSLAPLEIIKKALEWKGYNVGGTAMKDPTLSNVFMSCNLADEQTPNYNLGNPRFGKIEIGSQWNNFNSDNGYLYQELSYPYERVYMTGDNHYNFDGIDIWNMWDSTNNPSGVQMTNLSEQYLFDPSEHLIVIPADGWYKIRMIVGAELSGYNQTFTAKQTVYENVDGFVQRDVTITNNINERTPLEIQLVKNYDGNAELIKGKWNTKYENGNGTKQTWLTAYPHQELYGAENPTNRIAVSNAGISSVAERMSGRGADIQYSSSFDSNGNTDSTSSRTRRGSGARRRTTNSSLGYMPADGKVFPYDQNVSEAFICGFSSMGDGTVAVMKNGKSWYRGNATKNHVLAKVDGLQFVSNSGTSISYEDTYYNSNTLTDSPSNVCTASFGTYLSGQVHLVTYLKKNDVLELLAIQRDYDGQKYKCSASTYVMIEAVSDEKSEDKLRSSGYGYYTPTTWPYELNLANFLNNEMKVSDFINDVVNAFNLEVVQEGMNIDFNLNRGVKKTITAAIDIDDRVNDDEAVSSMIDYPKEIGATFRINTEEYGYEQSVPEDWINTDEWAEHGDVGSSLIRLSNDEYVTKKDVTDTNFSYSWWCDFELKNNNDATVANISIPVIELSEYMADGYGYEEAMKHDGYGLTPRFWFRSSPLTHSLKLSSWMDESVNITLPVRVRDGFALSYYPTEKSLLTEYFNVHPLMASNYVEVEVWLTPQEYDRLRKGTLVHYNDDLYYVCSIDGFDVSGRNRTKLKLMKK